MEKILQEKIITVKRISERFLVNNDDWRELDDKEVLAWIKAGGIAQDIPKPVPEYQRLRAAEYPDFGTMIDAMCKAMDGDDAEYKEIQAQRLAIKAKYPKPEQ